MQSIYTQLVGCAISIVCSITFGILLKKHPSKSFTVAMTVIIHMVLLCAYLFPLFYILFQVDITHYDVMLGIPLLGYQTGLQIVGTVMILLGIFFFLISFFTLAVSGKGLPAIVLSEKLAAKGIYTFTRNPMSLGFYLILISFGLLRGSIFFIIWTLIVIIPTHICYLKSYEERELESRFGQPYVEYKKKVPFLIPNLRNISKQEKSKKTKLPVVRMLLCLACLLLVALFVVTIYYINEVRLARRDTQALVEDALNHYGTKLSPSDLSPVQRTMLLAVEDPTFTRHHGVDLETPGAGMTTLTQGLVKLLYFPNGFRPGIAKIRQTLIAQYALDEIVSKDDQLLLFLNVCYLGNENGQAIHGYANAARIYFGKEFSAITDDEFLSLVAMHIGPNALKPGTTANEERVRRIKRYLSGQYQPAGLLDFDYKGKQHGTLAEEALMAFLRLVTNARPE